MTLVLEDERLDRHVLCGLLGDLLGLADRDAGVVLTVQDSSGASMLAMLLMGLISSRNSRSSSSEPYSASRSLRRHSPVFSRNVTKFAMPTMSTPAAQRSGYSVSAARTMKPP